MEIYQWTEGDFVVEEPIKGHTRQVKPRSVTKAVFSQSRLQFTLSPCNIFRCLTCTGTQESRPCSPPPRSMATSTSGISGGPACHQIVKQEDINRDPQKPAQSFQTIVGASHIRWSRGDCTYLARCSMSDKVQRCIWQQREDTAERFLLQCS